MIDVPKRLREAAILLAVAVFLSATDTYGVRESSGWPISLAFWLGLVALGAAVGEFCVFLYYRNHPERPAWLMFILVSNATALTVFVTLLSFKFYGASAPPLASWPVFYGFVWVIAAAMTGLGYLLSRATAPSPRAPEAASGAGPVAKFLDRLPIKFRGAELWAVSSEDHYLRVHTDRGTELILMRLADAVRELAGADGLQVHRSWWVAKAGIAASRKESGKHILLLHSGVEVPVSRSYASQVKAANL